MAHRVYAGAERYGRFVCSADATIRHIGQSCRFDWQSYSVSRLERDWRSARPQWESSGASAVAPEEA